MSFAEKLKKARCDKKYSQEELAEEIGVSRQTITKWESETGFPEMKKAFWLAAKLNVSLDWLFQDELKELGWTDLSDDSSVHVSPKSGNISLQKVDEVLVQKALDKLYNPIITDKMPTRIKCLDDINGGLSRGNVYTVLGAPAIGKMSFAINVAVNYLRDNRNVMFVLKGRTAQSILRRIICTDANVDSFIGHGEYTTDDNKKIRESAEFVQKSDLMLDDSYDEPIEKLYEKCVKAKQKLDLLVIDNAKLLHTVMQNESDTNQKQIITATLYAIARECRCAVLIIDSIEQGVAGSLKKHNTPEMVVKKYIQNATFPNFDNMIFIHRDDYYTINKNEESLLHIIFNDNHRDKDTRYVYCMRNKKTGKITDLCTSPEKIIEAVASYFDVSPEAIKSRERLIAIAKPRQIAMYICQEKQYSMNEISKAFNKKDHTTIIHAYKKVGEMMLTDPVLKSDVEEILRRINEYGSKEENE